MKTNFLLLILVSISFSDRAFADEVQHDAHVKSLQAFHHMTNGLRMRTDFPDDVQGIIRSFLGGKGQLQVLESLNSAHRQCVYERDRAKWLARVAKIEGFFKKYDQAGQTENGFIPLPTGGAIASAGFDQEFGVFLLGKNPSHFKEEKYCPRLNPDGTPNPSGYKEVTIKSVVIGMCPDLPLEQIAADSNDGKDSDEELFAELNRTYQNAGLPTRFRRQTRAEYNYADTVHGAEPKLADEGHREKLRKYTPYWEISNQSPSGEHQPRPIAQNMPNSLGFRRSGVWEWTHEMEGSDRALVGGCWDHDPGFAASGVEFSYWPVYRDNLIGPSRPVRTE